MNRTRHDCITCQSRGISTDATVEETHYIVDLRDVKEDDWCAIRYSGANVPFSRYYDLFCILGIAADIVIGSAISYGYSGSIQGT